MTLRPAEWLREFPDCGRPVSVPADRCTACQERRHAARTAWEFCPVCGSVNGRHATDCTALKGTSPQ